MTTSLRSSAVESRHDTRHRESARLRPPIVVVICFLLFFAVTAIWLGADGTPDFRIYHFYNGFSALHDRTALDIAPAQLQTMLFGGLDGLNYLLFRGLGSHPAVLNVVLSLPYTAAAICVFVLSKLFFPAPRLLGHGVCAASALVGLTGAGTLPTLATTMTDVTAAVPLLASIAYWLSRERTDSHSLRSTALAGLLAGVAVGLKLTLVPVFVGLFVAIAARQVLGRRSAALEAVVFGLAGLVVFFAIDASWLLHNVRAYDGNPIFPMLNNVFRSDYASHAPWGDTRFLPKTLKMALFYPAYWTFRISQDTIELPMRDPRILVGWLCALLVVGVTLLRLVGRRRLEMGDRLALSLALIYLVAYALWEVEWSIYRYLAIDECLTGVMLLAALSVCLRSVSRVWLAAIFALVAVPVMAATQYPWWSRAMPAPLAVDVAMPALEPNAMVIFLDPYAYSYLVPSMPRTVRVIGANNNIIRPNAPGKLQAQAEAAIDGHAGPLWGMDFVQAFPGVADATLQFYHLHRDLDTCRVVQSNIEDGPHVRLCRLGRD